MHYYFLNKVLLLKVSVMIVITLHWMIKTIFFTHSPRPLQVENTNEIFESKKDQPPIQNEPPVAGAIRWAQFLFHRLKQTIILFLKVPEMLKCELINTVNQQFNICFHYLPILVYWATVAQMVE